MSHPLRGSGNPRPTLPPIRDLFRDELSGDPNPVHGSPSLTLARLRVTDEEDDEIPSRRASTSRTQPIYRVPPGHSEPASHHNQYGPYITSAPQSQTLGAEYRSASASFSNQATYYQGFPTPYPPTQFLPSGFPPTNPRNPPLPPLHSHPPPPLHRSTFPQPSHSTPHPHHSYRPENSTLTRHKSEAMRPDTPWNISTTMGSRSITEDDERTPVASRYNAVATNTGMPGPYGAPVPEDTSSGPAKYECHYCGKGFSRPSSLKIHLNSHTGEKPFICPVESCGRSFSVLSNMRRHARVHNVGPAEETFNDDGPSSSNPHPRWHQRRDSVASSSSNNSRRSRSVSSNDVDDEEDHFPKKNRSKAG